MFKENRVLTGRIVSALLCVASVFSCADEGVAPVVQSTIESVFAVNDNGMVTIGWTGFENGVPDEFQIHRANVADFEPTPSSLYASVTGSVTRFVDTGVVNGGTYYYRIVPVEISASGGKASGTASNTAVGRPVDYSLISDIRYGDHIQSMFNSSCAVHGCHIGDDDAVPGGGRLQRTAHGGQFSLNSWEDLFYGEKDAAVVIPFKSSKSDLVFHTNIDTLIAPVTVPHMPLTGFDLPADAIRLLIRWIDEGAKNDAGVIPFPTSPAGRIVSVCASEDLLAVTDVATNFVIRYINVGHAADSVSPFGAPHHVKADPQGEHLYATLINAQELWKFSASSYEHEGTLSIPFQPADVALSQTGDSAYVTSFSSTVGLVTLVDTRTMQILQSIQVPFASNPHGILISHDGSKAFVTNTGSGNLTMINTADNSTSLIALDTLGNPFSSNVSPYLVDITPDDRYLFVTDYSAQAQNVYIVDLLLDPSKPSHVIPIGGRSVHVAVTPDGSKAFVCNLTLNRINVISIPDFGVTYIPSVGKQPHGVIFTPDGTTAYVTTENTLSPDPPHHPTSSSIGVSYIYVIDVASTQIVGSIEVGAFGQGLTFVP